MSFNEIVDMLNRQGHKFSFKQVPQEVFATLFPGGAEMAEIFSYFQAHTYLGSDSYDRIALANKIAGRQPTKFSTWARLNFPAYKSKAIHSSGSLRSRHPSSSGTVSP
jgi:hypothetical protein